MLLQVLLTNQTGTVDVTALLLTARWAGDYTQAARTLDLSLVASPTDQTIPRADCPVGAGLRLTHAGEELFNGFVVSRTGSTDGNSLDLTAYDRGFYLKRNKVLRKYTAALPEDVAAGLCAEFGLEVGSLAKTGVPITRLFATGNDSLYDILATAYTLAAQSNGKAYHIGFRGSKLYITEKEPEETTLILKGGSNLIAATTTESAEKLVSAVLVYDANDNLVRTLEDPERLQTYGRLQEIVKQTAADDKAAEAQKKLDDGVLEQKITVEAIGNIACTAGRCVVVQEPYTGLYGLFWIDSDTHEWKRGQYYNKLILNYRRLMDEKEAGSLPNADGAKTGGSGSGGKDSGLSWAYDYYNRPKGAIGSVIGAAQGADLGKQ